VPNSKDKNMDKGKLYRYCIHLSSISFSCEHLQQDMHVHTQCILSFFRDTRAVGSEGRQHADGVLRRLAYSRRVSQAEDGREAEVDVDVDVDVERRRAADRYCTPRRQEHKRRKGPRESEAAEADRERPWRAACRAVRRKKPLRPQHVRRKGPRESEAAEADRRA
jgi:hypothetical protein